MGCSPRVLHRALRGPGCPCRFAPGAGPGRDFPTICHYNISITRGAQNVSRKKKKAGRLPRPALCIGGYAVSSIALSAAAAARAASSFCLKRPLALKPGIEVDSSRLDTLVLGLV